MRSFAFLVAIDDGSYTNLFLTKAGFVTAISGTNPTFTNTIQAEPYGVVLSGYYYSSILRDQNQLGTIWLRTSVPTYDDGIASYNFQFRDIANTNLPGDFNLNHETSKYIGRAVRCVLMIKMAIYT